MDVNKRPDQLVARLDFLIITSEKRVPRLLRKSNIA